MISYCNCIVLQMTETGIISFNSVYRRNFNAGIDSEQKLVFPLFGSLKTCGHMYFHNYNALQLTYNEDAAVYSRASTIVNLYTGASGSDWFEPEHILIFTWTGVIPHYGNSGCDDDTAPVSTTFVSKVLIFLAYILSIYPVL